MPAPVPPASPAARSARAGMLAMIGRHQVASLLATGVDFAGMVLAVELLHLAPAVGALIGAACGAITNFQLGRHWTFRARHESAGSQAVRYAIVSAASAGLNALGEYAAHDVLGLHYVGARVVVATLVSLLWNFPMQRYFVFRAAPPADEAREAPAAVAEP